MGNLDSSLRNNFDMESVYNKDIALTINALVDEIQNDLKKYDAVEYEKNTSILVVKKKIKSKDRSGIIDKLNDDLNFDIENIAEKSKKDIFDMFRLLKKLFFLEKVGANKNQHTLKKQKIKIIDILAKPRLANIQTASGISGEHSKAFEELYKDIKSQVSADIVESRPNKLNAIALDWERLVLNIMQFTYMDYALSDTEKTLDILKEIEQFLNEYLKKPLFSNRSYKKIPYKEGVMNTFFNILCCHRIKCVFENFFQIDYSMDEYVISDDYIKSWK